MYFYRRLRLVWPGVHESKGITMEAPLLRTYFLSLFTAMLCVLSGYGQHRLLHYHEEDRAIFQKLADSLSALEAQNTAAGMTRVGRALLGTPYVAQTLEVGEQEMLVVNFRGLDCTTFVENTLVLGHLMEEGKLDWDRYIKALEKVRYRGGKLDNYASRLHYFTDWIRENEAKGLVRDVTEDLYGVTVYKEINFMGTHREAYPFLASEENYEEILKVEKTLSAAPLTILPTEEVSRREALLQDGDIIALATDIDGLDVTHTGLAIRMDSGRVHLLHASTVGEVVISEKPLAEYLKGVKRNIGIIVARPL